MEHLHGLPRLDPGAIEDIHRNYKSGQDLSSAAETSRIMGRYLPSLIMFTSEWCPACGHGPPDEIAYR
jgi:hypothetical protein